MENEANVTSLKIRQEGWINFIDHEGTFYSNLLMTIQKQSTDCLKKQQKTTTTTGVIKLKYFLTCASINDTTVNGIFIL